MASSPIPLSHPKPTRKPISKIPATIFLLKTCQRIQEVTQIHAQLVVTGLLSRLPTAGKLIGSYVSTSHIDRAWSVFRRIDSADNFSYNTMIRGLTFGNDPYNSILLYNEMLLRGLIPDNYTFTFVLKACSHFNALIEGKQLHCRIIKAGLLPNTHVHSSLIHMYANSNGLDCAQRVYTEFPVEDTLIKNTMILGYLRCDRIDEARQVFDQTVVKNAATWSVMVSGYTEKGMYREALGVFREMTFFNTLPNESMIVSALSACARLGALDQGRWIHVYIDRRIKAEMTLVLGTSLVEMYAKCGCMDSSYKIFKNMPRRDVVIWAVIISGFALHGQAEKSFELFEEMIASGIHPNGIIFVAVLSACSHGGHIEMGRHYFDRMVRDFRIAPSIKHYGCMVDLLGRAGQLAEAEELVTSMPEEPNSIIWGTLLAACKMHRDLRRGERVFRQLIELQPGSGDRFRLAGHLFAATGKQEDAIKVRKMIKEREMATTRGSSFIEVDGMVHEFVVGDIGHGNAREIYMMLEEIKRRLDMVGFVARREEVLLDIEEEEKEEALRRHSERLAIAYGLLSSKAKSPIRVFKNLRICRDCHSVIKFISMEYEREITVRDRNRFHVFKSGQCSCMDYW